jgi:peptide chain release factor 2
MSYGGLFDLPKLNEEIKELEDKTNDSSFWNDRENAESIIKQLNDKKSLVEQITNLKNRVTDNLGLISLLEIDYDEDSVNELVSDTESLSKEINALNLLLLLNGPYDHNDCILDIHSGAGGTEACDWADMLYRMYLRYCEKKNYKVVVLDYQAGDTAGIKSVSIQIKGNNAYGYLKNEKGVHRLVRISPFDSGARRHTSFASVDVTPLFDNDKIQVEINENDLKIDVYRSSGAGGQHVNKTESAVRITHLPTKIVVTCQNERSQIQNKEKALEMLKNKLYQLDLEKKEEELKSMKGELSSINFGSQIRSYVMHPYSLVKDHRTNYEETDVEKVLDGNIEGFLESNLKRGK